MNFSSLTKDRESEVQTSPVAASTSAEATADGSPLAVSPSHPSSRLRRCRRCWQCRRPVLRSLDEGGCRRFMHQFPALPRVPAFPPLTSHLSLLTSSPLALTPAPALTLLTSKVLSVPRTSYATISHRIVATTAGAAPSGNSVM